MKKNKLRNIIIFVLVFIGLSGIILGVDLTFNKPTTFNKIIATKLYKEPANKAFVDQNFYNCVVDAYNKKNRTELPYTTSLTDEQLESITDLVCSLKEIIDVSGLKKLPFLTYLNLRHNNLNNIDLSQNTALVTLYLSSNNLSELDLSKNTALTDLDLNSNNLSELDLSKNTALTTLQLRSNNISSIDLSKNPKLTRLLLLSNNISSINLSQNTSLTSLELGSNDIRIIDLSKNIELTSLYLSDNNLNSIDLSKNPKLTSLYLSDNNISSIDLSKNTALTSLELMRNNISDINLSNNAKLESLDLRENTIISIDLNNNTLLTSLDLRMNKLSSIDVKNNTKLTRLYLDYNKLSSIDVRNNVSLTTLNLGNNQLSTIYLSNILLPNNMTSIIETQKAKQTFISFGNDKNISPKSTYQHYFNSTIIIPNEVSIEDFDNDIGIENLTYKIYFQEEEITEGMIKEGYIFKLYDGDSLIETNIIKLLPVSGDFKDPNFYNCVVDTYNQKNKTELPYTISLTDEQLGSITDLVCSSKQINDIGGIEKLSSLITLNLSNNNLNSINLSKNPSLTTLYLSSNAISNIDLSKNVLLTTLSLNNNAINSIDLSNNVELETLSLYGNQLRSIDLSKNSSLSTLDLSSNAIGSIDLSNNVELENLHLYDNQLRSIDLRENPNLTLLNLWNNPYAYTIVMYTNDDVSLVSPVLLHNNKNSAFSNMLNENDSIFIQDGYIAASKMGKYNLLIEFNHNVQEQKNNYDVVYDIYVIEATSEMYEINGKEGYIYTYLDTDEEIILNNIEVNYGTKEIIDNKLIIKYEGEVVKKFDIVSISSSKYDLTKEYIYDNAFDKENINIINGTLNLRSDNVLEVKYGDVILDTYDIVQISSTKYDLSKQYIYTGTNEFVKENINITNGTLNLRNDNVLEVKYGDVLLNTYDIVQISSTKYDLSKQYIYTETNEFVKENINIINGNLVEENNKLKIKYNDIELESYDIVGINFGELEVGNKNIVLQNEIDYSVFTNNITTTGVTYKIFNEDTKITSGNIKKGMTLKLYYNDTLVDTFYITEEFLDLSLLKVDEGNKYILDMKIGDKVSDIISKVNTSGQVSIIHQDKELKGTDVLGTGSKLKVELNSETHYYEIIVIGDVNGDGKMNVSDIVKINNHVVYEDKKLDSVYSLAADYNGDNKLNIQDIVKINNAIVGGN